MTHKPAGNSQPPAFIELSSVDSTNNYALSLLREPNLTERQITQLHGTAVFAHEQTQGKGQRGKNWASAPDKNVHLSLIIAPKPLQIHQQFSLTALTALVTRKIMEKWADGSLTIKWPNDIYFQDRKAGGILIENIISGSDWRWAVIGIGLNINQTEFDPSLPNPVSLKQITGKDFDCLQLAKELASDFFAFFDKYGGENIPQPTTRNPRTLSEYNSHLYKRGQKVKLKKDTRVFEAKIREVTENGQLVVDHGMEERFNYGEITFVF